MTQQFHSKVFTQENWKLKILHMYVHSSILHKSWKVETTQISINWWRRTKCVFSQSCLTLCNPMNCSPPGLSVHGIFQARILEWIAIPYSRGISQPRDRTLVSCLAMQEIWVRSLGGEGPMEEGMAIHSSILAWRIPWTEEPGGL